MTKLFITGTGRCGTKSMAIALNGNHEYNVTWFIEEVYKKVVKEDIYPFETLGDRIRIAKLMYDNIDENFIDSSNITAHFIDGISYLYPDAKFILLVRNGIDFTRSAVLRGWHTYDGYDHIPRPDTFLRKSWDVMSNVERCAWMWVNKNEIILNRAKTIPQKQFRIVGIEDCGSYGYLDNLEAWSGIKFEDRKLFTVEKEKLNRTPKNKKNAYIWRNREYYEFYSIARNLMERFGYETDLDSHRI